MPITDGDLAIE
jgi:hypothetical protein